MSNIRYNSSDQTNSQYISRKKLCSILILVMFIVASIVYWLVHDTDIVLYPASKLRKRESLDVDALIDVWNQRKPLCSAPKVIDQMLNDPFILKYTRKVSFACNKTTIYTKLDQATAMLTLTKKAVDDHVSCYYSFLWRAFEQDKSIKYSEIHYLPRTGVELTNKNDIANVSCYKETKKVYKNTHLWIRDVKSKVTPRFKGPSVLVLFLESISNVSFKRYMKKTKNSLDNLGNIHYLNGFVKHEDNSFPNTMAFLTGARMNYDYQLKTFFKTYFDDIRPKINYLWDDFSSKGYVTGFLEDLSVIGIFNYGKWGWKTPPTDWDPRAFWVQMYPERGSYNIWKSMNLHEEFCFNKPKVETFLDQVYNFMNKMTKKKQPYFFYPFHSQMTHDDINNFQIVDGAFANFFERTKEMYRDTLLVLAGDHGPRYASPSVPSAYGRLEERMNLVVVRIPESLDEKYPHLRKILSANEDRLTSWLDIHKMVQDVAIRSFEPKAGVSKKDGAISPWRELIHPDRTCDDAWIFPSYCVCNGTINSDFRSPEKYDIYWAYKAVQDFVNEAVREAKKSNPYKFGQCKDIQKVNLSSIDMKYIIPQVEKTS